MPSRWIESKGGEKWERSGRGGTGPRWRVKKCEVARAAALSLSPSGGAAVGGRSEPRGATRGPASELHPLSRPLNPRAARLVRVYAALDSPSVQFVRLRVASSVRRKASRLPLPYLALPSRSLWRFVSRCAIGRTRIQWDLHVFFCSVPETTDRPTVRPSIRWCFIRESIGGFRDSTRKLRDYPLGFSVDSLLRIVPYESGRDDNVNLFCMVSTWNYSALTGDLCSPVDDLRSKFEGTSE